MASTIRQLAVLIDLSGTLHIGNNATPGAVEALKRLRSLPGVRVKFVTNTTKESGRYLHDRLTSIGFQIEKDEIFTSLTAARRLVEMRSLRPLLLLEDVALEDFEGIPYLLPDIKPHNNQPPPNAVVIGLAPSRFDYSSVNEAFQRILSDKAELIAIHKARYYKSDDGQLSLGPGPFVAALEYATECKPTVVGKPESRFFMDALQSMKKEPSEADFDLRNCVMIGDDARDDVAGAQDAGMKGILVKTGKYRNGDEKKIQPAPWAVVDNFAEAVDKIERDLLKK